MNSIIGQMIQTIEQEPEHYRKLNVTILNAVCMLETYYQKSPSALMKVCPDMRGVTISESEVIRLRQVLVKFIAESPGHPVVSSAVKLLAMSHDRSLKEFFVAQLRHNLEWRNSGTIFELLLALESLGEKVFYAADGKFIGSRSYNDTETNFPVAQRYLEKCGKHY